MRVQNGVKVHGLGFTKTKELKKYKFYSVDSCTWSKSATKGKSIMFYRNEEIMNRKLKTENKKIKTSLLCKHNFIEWCKYQRVMNNKEW